MTIPIVDLSNSIKHFSGSGDGSSGSPYIFAVTATSTGASDSAIKAEDAAAANADNGLPILGVRNDGEVDRTSANGDYGMLAIDSVGRLYVRQIRCQTGTESNVASSATNVTLLALNSARLGATIYNDSTQVLYLKLGATATVSSYTVQLQPGEYYEVPFNYTGIIDGIWASANGSARVTELT